MVRCAVVCGLIVILTLLVAFVVALANAGAWSVLLVVGSTVLAVAFLVLVADQGTDLDVGDDFDPDL